MRKPCLISIGLLLALTVVAIGRASDARAAGFQCSIVVDQASGEVLLRQGACGTPVTPMSTFKVPLALMGFDAGVLSGPHDPVWKYKKKFDAPKRAQKPVDPTVWQSESIVWYSQELTRKLGAAKFAHYVQSFGYGNADVSGGAGRDGLTQAWLGSSLAISADQQVDFLRRMLNREIPVSQKASEQAIAIVPAFESGEWKVRGKTGSGWMTGGDSKPVRSRPVGWFVGWAERRGRILVFARLTVGDKRATEPQGLKLRDEFLRDWPAVSKSF